ncbi:hypothetical protein CYR55_14065 [Chimaeribacter californicus]|uniref:DUF1640 domain-containing protein n=2 Tax=Chimaeribacter californicus TaxID=2060067 RepID=A0A2N5E2T2_9GAMM|nr:hypothetical protein CYR55_14065 [Chimaeribacter californicus]
MNHNISYDAAIILQQAGFSDVQVEALVNFQKSVNAQLATSTELQMVKAELQTDMRIMKSELKHDIAQLENRLTLRFGAIAVFIIGALGAMKFFA